MKFKELKQQQNMMKTLGDMVERLEYSPLNTLEQPRKDLHRNIILPQMNEIYTDMNKGIKDLENLLKEIGIKNVDDVDIDLAFEGSEEEGMKYLEEYKSNEYKR